MKDTLRQKHSQIRQGPKFQSKSVAEVDQGKVINTAKLGWRISKSQRLKTFIYNKELALS